MKLPISTLAVVLTTIILVYVYHSKPDMLSGILSGQKNVNIPLTKERWMEIVNLFGPKAIDHGYGSHSVVLLAAVAVTKGDIVEFGSGFHSTPMLHNYSQLIHGGKRKLLTADTDAKWLSKFTEYASDFHTLRHVAKPPDWSNVLSECGEFEYGVIFIDHAPGTRRTTDLARVFNCAQLVVLHDTEQPTYKYGPGLIRYKYVHDFGRMFGAGVTVLSNYNQSLVDEVEKLIRWYRGTPS